MFIGSKVFIQDVIPALPVWSCWLSADTESKLTVRLTKLLINKVYLRIGSEDARKKCRLEHWVREGAGCVQQIINKPQKCWLVFLEWTVTHGQLEGKVDEVCCHTLFPGSASDRKLGMRLLSWVVLLRTRIDSSYCLVSLVPRPLPLTRGLVHTVCACV